MSARPAFVKLPSVLTAEQRQETREAFERITDDTAEMQANRLLLGYAALLLRARLAELALYKTEIIAGEFRGLVEKERRRGKDVDPAALVRLMEMHVHDYIEPLLVVLREAVEYPGPGGGYYLPLEELRAKLVGGREANRRLDEEGRP